MYLIWLCVVEIKPYDAYKIHIKLSLIVSFGFISNHYIQLEHTLSKQYFFFIFISFIYSQSYTHSVQPIIFIYMLRKQVQSQMISVITDESQRLIHSINPENKHNPFQSIEKSPPTVQRKVLIMLITTHSITDITLKRLEKNEKIDFTCSELYWKVSFNNYYYINIIRFQCQAKQKHQNKFQLIYRKKEFIMQILRMFKKVLRNQSVFQIGKNAFENNQLVVLNKIPQNKSESLNFAILSSIKMIAEEYKIKLVEEMSKQQELHNIFAWFKLFYDSFDRQSLGISLAVENVGISKDAAILHSMLLFYFIQAVMQGQIKNGCDLFVGRGMMQQLQFSFNQEKLNIHVCKKFAYSKLLSTRYLEMQLIYSITMKSNKKLEVTKKFFQFIIVQLLKRAATRNISQMLQAVANIETTIVVQVDNSLKKMILDRKQYDIQDYFNIRIKYINELIQTLNKEEGQGILHEFVDHLILFLDHGQFQKQKRFDQYESRIGSLFLNKRFLNKKDGLNVRDCMIAQLYWKFKYISHRTEKSLNFTFVFRSFLQEKIEFLFNYDFPKAVLALLMKEKKDNNCQVDKKIVRMLFENYNINYHHLMTIILEILKDDEQIYDNNIFSEMIGLLRDKAQFHFESFFKHFNQLYQQHHGQYKHKLLAYFCLFLNSIKIDTYQDFHVVSRTESAIMEGEKQLQDINQNRRNIHIDYSNIERCYKEIFNCNQRDIRQMFSKRMGDLANEILQCKMGEFQDKQNELQNKYG